MLGMKERVTISVDPEALAIARVEVEEGRAPNLSVAVEDALRARGKSQAIRESLAMLDEMYGPVDEETHRWARKELNRAFHEASSSTPER